VWGSYGIGKEEGDGDGSGFGAKRASEDMALALVEWTGNQIVVCGLLDSTAMRALRILHFFRYLLREACPVRREI
jgi:hypothetical protein